MVKINKIYTKTGDDGSTGLVGGKRTAKDSLRVVAYGDIDELNCAIGVASACAARCGHKKICEQLELIQNELFDAGAELATPPGESWPGMEALNEPMILRLEGWIDQITDKLPELRSFVLPGSSELNAYIHLARAVCRRAERSCVTLTKHEALRPAIIVYLNRLSDFLFALARHASHLDKKAELLWVPASKRSST
ncbi:MAG: cob(I)yrinic acid a,c-diamide adenosyltransferase [Oligoflexia bacterium]|nr:cob(I)yrinic acid a,c-diamide adenosyltransferase [Oligoflexia bacterium]